MTDWAAMPAAGGIKGELRPPSDKSVSHRAVLLGAVADGTSVIRDPLLGEDVLCTIGAMRLFGARIKMDGNHVEVDGSPGLRSPDETVNCGNAGTLMRLLAGHVCGRDVSCVLDGDGSLRKRPMRRISRPLAEMGAKISTAEQGTPPVAIGRANGLRRIEYTLPTASAQIKSAILLAGLVAEGGAKVIEPVACRDHTELMLPEFGAPVRRDGTSIEVGRCMTLRPADIQVPADISSAAFFIVAASIVPGSELLLREVCVNPTRAGIIGILHRMGATIDVIDKRTMGNEEVADLLVRHSPLSGTDILPAEVPSAIDELPVILAAAAVAAGQTTLRGAAELRAKESDRLAAMAAMLSSLGVGLTEHDDGMDITGTSGAAGGEVSSQGDHRIAMAAAALALRSDSEVRVRDCDNVATSFPGFLGMAASVGWEVKAC